jgi:hypothetical protein
MPLCDIGGNTHVFFSFNSPVKLSSTRTSTTRSVAVPLTEADGPTILQTFLVRLADHSIWQSLNEGYTWDQKFPQELFLAFYHHKYASNRAYLITNTARFYVTTDSGRTWTLRTAPTPPNTFRARVLRFHPDFDRLIWTGNRDCDGLPQPNCRAEAQYSRDNGRHWSFVEHYVVNCAWAMDATLHVDHRQILYESYRDKTGSQRLFQGDNPLALVAGSAFFTKKKTLFENVVGFATFAEFLVVAEVRSQSKYT